MKTKLARLHVIGAIVMGMAAGGVYSPRPAGGQGTPLTPDQMNQMMKIAGESQNQSKQTGELKVAKKLSGNADGVLCVVFSHDGRLLVSGGGDKTVRIWEATTGKALQVLKAHGAPVLAIDISVDGKHVVSGGLDGQIIVWNAESGDIEATWTQPAGVNNVRFWRGGEQVISSSDDRLLSWKVGEDKVQRVMEADDGILCLDMTKEGIAVTGDGRGNVEKWDCSTGKRLAEKSRPELSHITKRRDEDSKKNVILSVHVTESGDVLLSDYEAMWRWDSAKDTVEYVMSWPSRGLLTFNHDHILADFSGTGVMVHDFARDYHLDGEGVGDVHCIAVSPSENYIAVARNGRFDKNWQWTAGGATSVELYNVPGILQRARSMETSAAAIHVSGQKSALAPYDHLSPQFIEEVKKNGWK